MVALCCGRRKPTCGVAQILSDVLEQIRLPPRGRRHARRMGVPADEAADCSSYRQTPALSFAAYRHQPVRTSSSASAIGVSQQRARIFTDCAGASYQAYLVGLERLRHETEGSKPSHFSALALKPGPRHLEKRRRSRRARWLRAEIPASRRSATRIHQDGSREGEG